MSLMEAESVKKCNNNKAGSNVGFIVLDLGPNPLFYQNSTLPDSP